ncbi:hypothetical protein AALP_AA6G196400 [Arabis alpina]|uniref:Uncharacterized protein n=1 Tax=Arabis alpina TaxID=50452 RepID=A0A087GQC4_ARAAL|nr:hypothetical protein AALP_AA6G196400 [Arabis alpina]
MHLIDIFVLGRELGVDVTTELLDCLVKFRTRGPRENLRYTVSNPASRRIIGGFLTIDDHFEDHFLFVRISEKTVDAGCIDFAETRSGRREVDGVVAVTPRTRALAAVAPRTLAASLLHPLSVFTPEEIVKRNKMSRKRALYSGGKGKGLANESHTKKHRGDASSSAVVEEVAPRRNSAESSAIYFSKLSAVGIVFPSIGGLRHREAYATTTDKASEFFVHLNQLVADYDDDLCKKVVELRESQGTNASLEEMTRDFEERLSRVAVLLAQLGGKAKEDMMDLAEVDANLEFIKLLQGKKVPKLEDEVKRLKGQQDGIYDAWDVFKELLADVKEVLGILDVAGATSIVQDEQVSEVAGPTAAEISPPEFLTGVQVGIEGVDPEERADEDAA